jgi:hypothetical protein
VISSAQNPAIQARLQPGCPALVKTPATRIMRIGIDATARLSMFVIFHLMKRSVRIARLGDPIERRSRSGRLFEADVVRKP